MTEKEVNILRKIIPNKNNDPHDNNKDNPWVKGSLDALRQAKEL